ncbi:hypothetical protein ACWCPQ_17955 [Nocardia sp. NPDC001965]
MFDPGAARAQIVIEEIAELPDPGDSGDPDDDDPDGGDPDDDDAPNKAVYKCGRFYLDLDKARRRGGDETPG